MGSSVMVGHAKPAEQVVQLVCPSSEYWPEEQSVAVKALGHVLPAGHGSHSTALEARLTKEAAQDCAFWVGSGHSCPALQAVHEVWPASPPVWVPGGHTMGGSSLLEVGHASPATHWWHEESPIRL